MMTRVKYYTVELSAKGPRVGVRCKLPGGPLLHPIGTLVEGGR